MRLRMMLLISSPQYSICLFCVDLLIHVTLDFAYSRCDFNVESPLSIWYLSSSRKLPLLIEGIPASCSNTPSSRCPRKAIFCLPRSITDSTIGFNRSLCSWTCFCRCEQSWFVMCCPGAWKVFKNSLPPSTASLWYCCFSRVVSSPSSPWSFAKTVKGFVTSLWSGTCLWDPPTPPIISKLHYLQNNPFLTSEYTNHRNLSKWVWFKYLFSSFPFSRWVENGRA